MKRKIHNKRQSKSQKLRFKNIIKRQKHNKQMSLLQKKRRSNEEYRKRHNKEISLDQKKRFKNNIKYSIHKNKVQLNERTKYAIYKKFRNSTNLSSKFLSSRKYVLCKRKKSVLQEQKRMANLSIRQKNRLACKMRYRNTRELLLKKKTDNRREKLFSNYFENIKKGPTIECGSCQRLWFDKSVEKCNIQKLINPKVSRPFIRQVCSSPTVKDDNLFYLCKSCISYIKSGQVPPLSTCKKELKFSKIGEPLKKLTPLEAVFVSPRIGFMKIYN
uniref:Uncharacterized protein n=2 Tax=Cacopsylla melanoneura TaxID=428564 RepID=A0A8D8T2U0_9HEMI